MNSQQLYIDVRICNYKGEPIRIFAQYDNRNNAIILSNILPYRPVNNDDNLTNEQKEKKQAIKRDTILVVDNRMAFDDYDMLFLESEHLDFAAQAYFEYEKQQMLIIPDELKGRTNLQSIIEMKKLELNKGSVWELNSQSVQNTHIAVLALCYAAKKATIGRTMGNLLHDDKPYSSDHSMMPCILWIMEKPQKYPVNYKIIAFIFWSKRNEILFFSWIERTPRNHQRN